MLTGFLVVGDPVAAVDDTGSFELEGNAVRDSVDDWANVCKQVTVLNDGANAVPDECTTAAGTTGATAVSWASDGALNATIFTGGGSKDPQDVSSWAWKDGSGGLPDKDNLLHSFAARYSLAPSADCPVLAGASTCEVLFFGSDRYDNNGDAQQGFWFFQNEIALGTHAVGGGSGFTGVHRNGDLLVISDFSNGGSKSTITVYQWDTTCLKAEGTVPVAGKCGDANLRTLQTSTAANCSTATSDLFCGIVNPANGTIAPWSFTDKAGNNTYRQGELFEGGINLSALGLGDRCFSSVASETRSSTSTTAVLKDFVLGRFGSCGSSIATVPKTGSGADIPTNGLPIGTGSVAARDSAVITVTGTSTWTGNLQFYLCGPVGAAPATCSAGGAAIGGPIAVTQASSPVLSAAASLTSAGRYCWRAEFTSTTTGVPNASDSSLNECFTVIPVTATLSTQAVASPVAFGQPAQDRATLGGTATQPGTNGPESTYPTINATNGLPAGGKITFTLLKNNCTDLATGTGTNPQDLAPVSGNATYGPVSFTPDAPGTYHWKAQYVPLASDPNNVGITHNGGCTDSNETVVVDAVPTTISTRQFVFPQDRAMIGATAGGNLEGSVTFKLYDTLANCTANGATGLLYTETPPAISGAAPQSVSTNNTSYRVADTTTAPLVWRVTYTSTNTNQLGSSSVCDESTAVTYAGNDASITF